MKQERQKRKRSLKKILKHKIFRKRNIFSILVLIIMFVLIIFLQSLNILPFKYILFIIFGLFIINVLGIISINVHRKIFLKILGAIVLTLSFMGSIVAIYYIRSTNDFLNSSFRKETSYTKYTYYVLSKKDKNLDENSIEGEIATYKETANLSQALEKLDDKFSFKEKQYDDLGELFLKINDDTENFMLIEKASYEIVFSIDTDLVKEDYEIIYEFDVYIKNKVQENTNIDKFNIFIGGTDFAGLMDFNMIATVNTKTHQVLLTSIPRDYYIEVAFKDERYDKLSFMNAYGPDTNKNSLEKLFNITIDYSVIVDTNSLITVVDYLGGIEFCSDQAFTTTHALVKNTYNDTGKKLKIVQGCQNLNGIETLAVARERNAFSGRDRVRQENCQKIIIAIFKKLVSTDTILNYNETLNTLETLYETDMPKTIITTAAKDILSNGNQWKITTQSVDGIDGHDKVHLSNMIDWVMYPDMNTVASASDKIKKTLE